MQHVATLLTAPQHQSVRPIWWTGQTGLVEATRQGSNERLPGRDPVGAGAPWVALGLAGQLGHLQTSKEMKEEQNVEVGKARVKEKKVKTMKDKCI